MMPYLLNVVYLVLLAVLSPYLVVQAIRKGKYREGFAAKFLGRVPPRAATRRCLWFHAVSVGEVNLLVPLLNKIAAEAPEWQCVVSTTTMTGMALAKKKYAGLSVFYCPLDFSWAVRTALRRIRPDVLVLAELELWPNLLSAARAGGVRVAIVNGRLSERSFRGYRRIRPLAARMLRQVDLVAVQDETYAARFRDLGAPAERVRVTGSMKFDGAQTDRGNPATARLAALAGFATDDVVWLCGSTQEPEEEAAIRAFAALSTRHPRLRLVIVPRHPERFDAVARMLDESGTAWRRRTRLEAIREGEAPAEPPALLDKPAVAPAQPRSAFRSPLSPILLVDCVGELGAWWGTAQIAFVGGSLGNRGGQNMIEPAAYGAAVCFGPNTRNFRDIVDRMLAAGAAVVVGDGNELAAFVDRCLTDAPFAARLGEAARRLVQSQLGATQRTYRLLRGLVE